jgi:hypothetical protein
MLQPATDETILGNFNVQDPNLTFTKEQVRYVIGGQYKQRYLTEIDGELYVLPAEWNVLSRRWVAYHPQDWRERPYRQLCAGCHTTGYDPVSGTWSEPGVWCEACHGPGSQHVASTGNRAFIVNPARLDFKAQAEVCGQCHSRGLDLSGRYPFPVGFRPGGPARLAELFVFTTDPSDFWPDGSAKRHHMQFLDWQKGEHSNAVNCIFCHVSHSVGETDHQTRMVGNDRCVICHESKRDQDAHIPFMAGVPVECTDCHMPAVSQLVPTDFQIVSHTFWPPDPRKTLQYGQERMPTACYICHTDKPPEWAISVLGLTPPEETPPAPTSLSQPTPVAVAAVAAAVPPAGQIIEHPRVSSQDMAPVKLGLSFLSGGLLTLLTLGGLAWWVRSRKRGSDRL